MAIVLIQYVDVNPNYGLDTHPELLYAINAINSSIQNILSTNPGERWFYPEFGCGLESFLFEPVDTITAGDILFEVLSQLRKWEPRITVLKTSTIIAQPDTQTYQIIINYEIIDIASVQGTFSALLYKI
jgi:phage baseplate assembly protein W